MVGPTSVGMIDRTSILPQLFVDPNDYLIITGLAGAAKDAASWTGDADNLLTFGGAMGGALPTALGTALCAPNRNVLVITGDAELLMSAGALATTASARPDNLTIVCIDNAQHGETGGQPSHTAMQTKLSLLAEGAGIPSVMTLSAPEKLEEACRFLKEKPGPRFLCVRVRPGPPSDYKRVWDLVHCRVRFKAAFISTEDRQTKR